MATMSPASAEFDLDAAELVEDQQVVDIAGDIHPFGLHQHGLLPAFHPPGGDPADRDPADVLGKIERRTQHLERVIDVDQRPRDVLYDHVVERLHISGGRLRVVRREPGLARGEDVGKIELFLAGIQLGEGVEDLVEDLIGPSIGAVNLVDHDDRPDVAREGLAQHELRLRHRSFERVHEHQGAVGHLEGPLDLAAEIGVSGRVDQVDLDVAILDRNVLGQNGDATLSFQVIRVEDALALKLRGPILPRLTEHRVDQRGLAVVDVGNNGYVTDVIASVHRFSGRRHPADRVRV